MCDMGRSILAVFFSYFLWGYAERDGSHVYHFMTLHAGETEVKTWMGGNAN